MENKRNEATINRPEGDRVIDAPYVFADLDEYTRQLKEEEAWEKNDRNSITLFKSSTSTIVLTCLHENAKIEHNPVDGLLTIQLLDGKLSVSAPDGDIEMRPRQVVFFHPGVNQSILATDDAVLLLTIQKK